MEKFDKKVNMAFVIIFALSAFIVIIGSLFNNLYLMGFGGVLICISLFIPIIYYGVILQIIKFINSPKNTIQLWIKRFFQTIILILLGIFPFILIYYILVTMGIKSGDEIAKIIILIVLLLYFALIYIFNKHFIRLISFLYEDKFEPYKRYIKENKTRIGLFVRPAINNFTITLANKYVVVKFDLLLLNTDRWELNILDKISGEEKIIKSRVSLMEIYNRRGYSFNRYNNNVSKIFYNVVDIFDYETIADDVIKELDKFKVKYKVKTKNHKNITLDINKASEAEFTAIPGITIAKAKHLAKVRKKQVRFLTMNQFYKAIELNEEFIEQIQTKGTKILLNKLPDIRKFELKEE